MVSRRISTAAVAAIAALALSATPALAKGGSGSGGGGGGTVEQPAPTFDPWTLCPEYKDVIGIDLPDGSTTFANIVVDTACVVVRADRTTGVISLYKLGVAPGWTYDIKSAGGGNSNTVDIEFFNPTTGAKHSFMTKPGKLVIK